jgi:MFS superfamily sulfate permease-like transporter
VTLLLVGVGVAAMILTAEGPVAFGPSDVQLPTLGAATFWTALTVLVLPQLPLSFANSCLATADAATTYFAGRATRVTPGRLATTLGCANLVAGAVSGMPVCHGAGGLTAHVAFGARTWRAPLAIGSALLVIGLTVGASLGALLVAFPLPILAGLLAVAGLLHIGLLRDLAGRREWLVALLVGLLGFQLNLLAGLGAGLALWWGPAAVRALRGRLPTARPSRDLA